MSGLRFYGFLFLYFAVLVGVAMGGYKAATNWDQVAAMVKIRDNGTDSYQLPKVTVGMNLGAQVNQTVHLQLTLDISASDRRALEKYQPRIMDRIITFTQSLGADEIKSPGTIGWLSQELLWQINLVSGPIRIKNVGITELRVS